MYNQVHMGVCADQRADEYNISRKDQDDFAIKSTKEQQKLGLQEILMKK